MTNVFSLHIIATETQSKHKERRNGHGQNTTITSDKAAGVERLAQLIATIPEKKQLIAVAVMNAYADGLIAGQQMTAGENSPV